MRTIREFEDAVHDEFSAGNIPGFVHLYAGEEASGVGVCMHLEDRDCIASTHRGHGHCIAKGCDEHAMMLEIFGKKDGLCGGKGGSMHIADFDKGMMGANSIVGAAVPLAVGAALASKTLGRGSVAVPFCGDGGANQGGVLESLNLASVWKLPVVFAFEDNGYAETTASSWSIACKDIVNRAAAFGMPGMQVEYDLGITLLSLVFPIAVTGLGFLVVNRTTFGRTGLIVAGLLMAAGIVARRAWPGMGAGLRLGALAGVALAVLAAGFAIQRHYLERRYENLSPQLKLADAVRWARDLRGATVAVGGIRGVFNQYPFYGTDLSNHVQWLGTEGEDGAFERIPTCAGWRQALADGGYTHVVTTYDPFNPGELTDTKEALWTREDATAFAKSWRE